MFSRLSRVKTPVKNILSTSALSTSVSDIVPSRRSRSATAERVFIFDLSYLQMALGLALAFLAICLSKSRTAILTSVFLLFDALLYSI